MTLRLLNRCGGPLSEATTAQIPSLSMERLEALADTLVRFQDSTDLTSWLAGRQQLTLRANQLGCHRIAAIAKLQNRAGTRG